MIEFKQKEFFGGAILKFGSRVLKSKKVQGAANLTFAATGIYGIKQGADAKKQQDAANEEMRRANKAQEKIAKQQAEEQVRIARLEAKNQEKALKQSLKQQQQSLKQQEDSMITQQTTQQPNVSGQTTTYNMPQNPFITTVKTLSETGISEGEQREFGKFSFVRKGIEGAANKIANSNAWKKISGTNFYKNARGFGKDMYTVAKQRGTFDKMADFGAMGVTMAGGSYLVNKAIQLDKQKNGEAIQPAPEQKKSGFKKAIGAVGAVGTGLAATGGTLLLARHGKLNKQTFKNIGNKVKGGFKGQFVKTGMKEGKELDRAVNEEVVRLRRSKGGWKRDPQTGKPIIENGHYVDTVTKEEMDKIRADKMKSGGINWLGTAFNIGFPAMTAVGYISEKKNNQNQLNQTANNNMSPENNNVQTKQNQYSEEEYYQQNGNDNNVKKKKSVLGKVAIGAGSLAAIGGSVIAARHGKFIGGAKTQMRVNERIARLQNRFGNGPSEKTARLWTEGAVKTKTRKLGLDPEKDAAMIDKMGTRYRSIFDKRIEAGRKVRLKPKTPGGFFGKVIDAPASLFGYGRKNRTVLSKDIREQSIKSGNKWTEKASKIVNPKNALLGSAVGLTIGSAMFKPMTIGENVVKKGAKAVDKNAFAYEESKNQEV